MTVKNKSKKKGRQQVDFYQSLQLDPFILKQKIREAASKKRKVHVYLFIVFTIIIHRIVCHLFYHYNYNII